MKDISNVRTEDIEKQTGKIPKKFFRKSKYIMRNPDLELEDYLTPDSDGLFTCGLCHAPIKHDQKFRVTSKVHVHEGCMLYYGGLALKHPRTYKQDVDKAREANREIYGERRRKVIRDENEFE